MTFEEIANSLIKKYEKRYAEQQQKFIQHKAHEMGYILVKV